MVWSEKTVVNFDKYTNYVRLAFKEYDRCIVKSKVKNDELGLEILIIVPKEDPQKQVKFGELSIKFDQDTVEFYGDFLADEYIDYDKISIWEKYTEEEIYGFLDKKIAEYKYYVDNGYFFTYYDDSGKIENLVAEVYTGDVEGLDYKKIYLQNGSESDYEKVKSVTVTNFYGDIIVENKILH